MAFPQITPDLFFQDLFTEASVDTALSSHTPDLGTSWSLLWQTDATAFLEVKESSDNVSPDSSQGNKGVMYTANATYPSADYEVSFVIGSNFTGTNRVYLLARVQDQENMYALRMTTGATVTRMYKKVSGTWTAIGSFKTDPSPGDTVTLRVVGSQLSYYYNGVLIDSQTDTAITSAGKAGVAAGGGAELAASTDDLPATGSFDNFLVQTPAFAYTPFATSVTSMPVNLPAAPSGDLLIAIHHGRNAGTWTVPTDWNEFTGQLGGGSVGELTVFWKISNGSEGGLATWTASTGTTGIWQVFRIRNWHGTSAPEIQTTSGDASAADPPSNSPSWGAADTLIMAIAGHSAASTAAWSAAPSGYSDFTTHGASSGGAAVCLATAFKAITGSSEDPGAFTVSGSNRWWAAATLAIRPAAAAGGDISKISGVAYASISKVSGVAQASLDKVSGVLAN